MLRVCLIAASTLLVAWLIWAASLTRAGEAWTVAAWATLVLLGLIFERTRYKPELTTSPGPGWIATQEIEVDEFGAVRVWCHPPTGERAYVREPARHFS